MNRRHLLQLAGVFGPTNELVYATAGYEQSVRNQAQVTLATG